MTGLAIGVVFLGYGFALWGYCLVKDYDVNIYELFHSEWPPPKFQQVGKKLTPDGGGGTGPNIQGNIQPL